MFGFCKIKYILLMMVAICVLSSCSTVRHNAVDRAEVSKPVNIRVTEDPKPTEITSLPDLTKNADEIKLQEAIVLIQKKKYPQAIGLLSQIKDSEHAEDLLEQVRYVISGAYIANLGAGIAALDNNGKVKIIIDDSLYKYYRYDEVNNWIDIKSFSFAQDRLDSLDKDGNIHSTRDTDSSYYYVVDRLKSYTDLSVISTDFDNYVLLSKTGDIYTFSEKHREVLDKFQEYISTWKDVVDVLTGQLRIAALNRDGTVFVADFNKYLFHSLGNLYKEIADWKDIVDISSAPTGSIAGLKSDGTVVISASFETSANNNFYDVSDWKDIIAISKSNNTLLGLKRDGTVVATGDNVQKQLEVFEWTDIVAIAAGDWISIGLKSDGTLVIAGETEKGVTEPDVSGVNNLYVPTITY